MTIQKEMNIRDCDLRELYKYINESWICSLHSRITLLVHVERISIYTYKVYCCTKFRYSLNMNDFLPLQFQVLAAAEVGVASASASAAAAVATRTKIIQFKNVNIQEGILMNPMA